MRAKRSKFITTVFLLSFGCAIVILVSIKVLERQKDASQPTLDTDTVADVVEDPAVPPAVTATPSEVAAQPKDTSALGGYNVLIADRGNNRLIEVTPAKKIVWQYQFNLPRPGLGADDSFFADGGKTIIVNLEEYHVLELIDYRTKQVTWSYGVPNQPGSKDGYLNTPDDAYQLPNGDISVADIKNCRILEIAPDKHIVRQYGQTKVCKNVPGYLNKPNGDTPLKNGHVFVSNITGHDLIELDENWQPVFSMNLPVRYPSDPQLTLAGNVLISDYSTPGKIVEVTKQGNIVWQYDGDGHVKMNKPSLAIELPNGNILANDDYNHRVIVIDKQTKQIVWQYGVTGKPGSADGQLNVPDGMDIIMRSTSGTVATAQASPIPNPSTLQTIGQVTRHASQFVNQTVRLQGYLIKKENGYLIFSDEPNGAISSYDLPVVGPGIDAVLFNQKYVLEGKFVYGGLKSSNGNLYHLELTSAPA